MIDTHCHLNHPAFAKDRSEVLKRAEQAGVEQMVVPGVNLQGFPGQLQVANAKTHIAFGLHPLNMADHPHDALEQLEEWIERSNPVAIGEIGLDYRETPQNHVRQKILFEAQLNLAKKHELPILVHVIKAHEQTLALLRRAELPAGGIIHSFNGSLQQAHEYIKLGFLLGFGGVATYDRATKIRRVAAELPDSALVLESDAPDLPPIGFYGQRNEPCYMQKVVETLAELRNSAAEHIVRTTSNSAIKLLGLCRD
ncbi:MAG: TatD family hydrolase [Magnetococcales bacterium]|nr:TatD family hydrolase [Magnetococcales bacterium]